MSAPYQGPDLLEQWERGWRALCPACAWTSKDLTFPNPDAALHCLRLHMVFHEGASDPAG